MQLRRPKKNFAFIDSQNLNLGTQKVGWKMDWQKFLAYLRSEHNVSDAYLFIGYMQEHEDMYKQLHDLGYLVVLKPTVGMFDTHGNESKQRSTQGKSTNQDQENGARRVVKGNIDAELVLYAMKQLPKYHQAVIVSGDGDFYCLAEYLEEKKRLKAILAPNWQYSSLLKPYERYIVRLDQLRTRLEHKDYRRRAKR